MEQPGYDSVTVRPMGADDSPILCEWVRHYDAGTPAVEQVEFFRLRSPDLYLATQDTQGRVMSYCCASRMGQDEALIDFYFTRPGYQGRGLGKRALDAVMSRLQDRNVGLFTYTENVEMYAKRGFPHVHYQVKVYKGRIDHERLEKLEKQSLDIEIKPISMVSLEEVLAFDDGICGSPRHDFLTAYFKRPELKTLVACSKGKVVGYLCLSPSPTSYKVIPFYASGPVAAQELWKCTLSQVERDAVLVMFVPVSNSDALGLFGQTLHLEGPAPDIFRVGQNPSHGRYNISGVYSIPGTLGVSI